MPLTMSSADQFTLPWLLQFSSSEEVTSSTNDLTFLLFNNCLPRFPQLFVNFYFVLSHFYAILFMYLNLLRQVVGELSISLVNMVMRQKKKVIKLTQHSTEYSVGFRTFGDTIPKRSNKFQPEDGMATVNILLVLKYFSHISNSIGAL